jgi:hypothetical protein
MSLVLSFKKIGPKTYGSHCVLVVLELLVKMDKRSGQLQVIIVTYRRILVCYEIRMVCNRWRLTEEVTWKCNFDGMKHGSRRMDGVTNV